MTRTKELPGIGLPLPAFRLSILDGTIDPPVAGVANSPLDSQPPILLDCVGVPCWLDYLTLLWTSTSVRESLDKVESLIECVFDFEVYNDSRKEDGVWRRVCGSMGVSAEYKSIGSGNYRVRLNLGGRVCSSLSESGIRGLLHYCGDKTDFSCTRIDYKVDDLNGFLCLDKIAESAREGRFTGYQYREVVESFGGSRSGMTVYFGGKKSLQRVRFYDKQAEGKLDYPCVRQEVQCRGLRAMELAANLLNQPTGGFCSYLLSRLRASITFGVKKDKNLNRTVVDGFWKSWVDFLSPIVVFAPPIKREVTLGKTIEWFAKVAQKALAKIQLAMGTSDTINLIDRILERGSGKLKESEVEDCNTWRSQYYVGEFELMLSNVLS